MMLHHLGVPERAISSVKFSCFNASEIRDLSAKRVTNPHSLDALLNPTEGGLYDAAYGASTRDEVCSTCGQGSVRCPGHMGHIELPLPVYHPLFFKTLFSLLRGSCLTCQKLLIPRKKMLLLALQLEALENGLVQTVYALKEAENELKAGSAHGYGDESVAALELQSHLEDVLAKHYAKLSKNNTSSFKEASDDPASNGWSRNAFDLQLELVKEFVHLLGKAVSRCPHCGASAMSVRSEHNSRIYVLEVQEKTGKVQESTMKYMTPSEVRTHFAQLWENEKAVLSRIFVAMADAAVGSKLGDSAERADKEPSSSNPRSSAVDVLFLNLLPVPPSRFRPIGCVNGKHFESPQTTAYSKVLMDCTVIRALLNKLSEEGMTAHLEEEEEDVTKMGQLRVKMANKNMDLFSSLPGKTLPEKMENAWHRLQQHVNSLFDSELDRLTVAGAEKCPGIKQLLEKKDGLFRKHMMGKRVNYAARSVISPDPYIATNEIGLPLVFATRLTYPTPVTPWNVQKLRKAVINGPKIYPGATHVVSGGRTILLSESNRAQREAVAKQLIATDDLTVDDGKHLDMGPKIVKRHIQTGDVMLLNRQPTLHKGSIMAHKVRVLPGEKTLRLHYANCKSYNADFDGDEMNAHFPQSELGRSEAYQLMSTDKQYLSGKDGKPLSCLIQDHMVAGVSMAIRGRFFKRDEYQQLLYNALMHLPHRVKLMKPSILKPQPLWSGKQIYSTILINVIPDGLPLLNLVGKSKIGRKEWQNRPSRTPEVGFIEPGDMCESQVIIRSAELLCGVLDKAHYGATEYGLVHATYELYGGEISGRLLTCLARLFTAFLQQYRGFTLGVEDILVTEDADLGRTDVIERTKEDGMETVAKTLNVKHKSDAVEVTDALWDAHVSSKLPTSQGEDKLAAVDHAMKKVSNSVNDQIAKWCTGNGLLKTFPRNNLQLMVISGAKGGAVNCMQISCLLGQIELEGRRPPLMPSGRSVPSFQAYSTDLRAGGFISQRFLTGIRPQEYFYHCMAGREGLVDTAVKTSRSGYLQRCLIKHLEGLLLSYDMTVRDSDGSLLQFLYGEDGIDIAKSSYLRQKQCDFVVDNFRAIEKQLPSMEEVSSVMDVRSALKKIKKFDKVRKKRDKKLRRYDGRPPRTSEFLEFSKQNEDKDTVELFRMWNELAKDQRECYASKLSQLKLPDPVISVCRPDRYFGSISERFYDETKEYLARNPANLSKEETRQRSVLSLDRVETLMKLRYQRSLCQPGESVGLLAAQSIGEPSTQMTLNTFHFAGRGEMNVTLGIPRLREILMVASRQIKTPQITVPVLDNRHNRAKRLCKELTKVMLSQVLHKFTLEERLVVGCGENGQRHRRCVLEMNLLPEKQFKKDLALTRDSVLRHIEKRFLRSFLFAVTKRMKLRASEGLVIEQRVARESARKGTSLDQMSRDEENGENSLMDNEADGGNPARGDDDDDDVDEEAGFDDGDAGVEALRRKKKDDVDYEEQDDGIAEENDEDATERVEHMAEASDSVENQNDEQVASSEIQQKADLLDIEMRIETVKNMSFGEVSIEDYEFDQEDNGWCKVTLLMPLTSVHIDVVSLVREEAASSPVRAVHGISRCILVPAQGQAVTDAGAINLVTDGINFYKIFENEDSLDVNRLYCNCIHSVASVYGIEAARRVIVTEIANVFAVYGIEVDPRHLSLVGDYMCFEGVYKPFNRAGIESCVSPLQQMSFETTMKFVNSAALHGLSDSLQSPSARIVAGQVVRGGTGTFSLVYPVAKCN